MSDRVNIADVNIADILAMKASNANCSFRTNRRENKFNTRSIRTRGCTCDKSRVSLLLVSSSNTEEEVIFSSSLNSFFFKRINMMEYNEDYARHDALPDVYQASLNPSR